MAERPFQESELYKLHAVVIALDRIAQQLLEPLGITYTEFLVMLSASESNDRTQSEIGQQMALGKASISLKVKALLEKGLVIQKQNPRNRRENFLLLTDSGKDKLAAAVKTLSETAEPAFQALGRERQPFHAGLETLMTILYELDV
ncbi:MAG: MarR family winged helix-turn-helix transcriptional regulator [Spirochaetales bacterium]